MNSTNNISARESFNQARRVLMDAWVADFVKAKKGSIQQGYDAAMDYVNGLKLSQFSFRSEVVLSTTANVFSFGVTTNQNSTGNAGAPFPTENRLTLSDTLVVSEYAIMIGQASGTTDVAWKLHTYGNLIDFAAADAAALNTTFYCHGGFLIKVGNDVVSPYRDLLNHWYVPQTQQTAAPGPASPFDQIRGSEDGFVTCEPNILIIGSKNYVPQIILPGNLASAAANLRAVFIARGVNAQNSTVVS